MARWWISDFVLTRRGAVVVRQTGHEVRLDWGLFRDIASWGGFYAAVETQRLFGRLFRGSAGTIAFLPARPRPWYLVWAVAAVGRLRVVDDPRKADIVMHFEDATLSRRPAGRGRARILNSGCTDISKSAVASAFGRAAGYGLKVDPAWHAGPMVEKSEMNAAHDGRIVVGPVEPASGKTYQRLIDNRVNGKDVEDLRTVTVGGEPVLVFRKRRPAARRFGNDNTGVRMALPAEVFSNAELALIRRFTREMQLDWGGLDVLRDRGSGCIYIVDANKTDMGPPIALPLAQKMAAVRLISAAFLRTFAPLRDPEAVMRRKHGAHANPAFHLAGPAREGEWPAAE